MRHLIVRIVCALALAPLAFPAGQAIWYVDDDALPGGDGTGWASAFDSIQDALDVVAVFDQVWVAAGNYVPEARLDPADPRSATFWVPPGTILLGGFAGRESSFAERAGLFERTVLSGHLGAPDLRTDDAYHVVYSRQTFGLPPQTEIDGFLIRGGYADGTSVNAEGGAIYTDNTALRLTNCILRQNHAVRGGAVSVFLGNFITRWCTFEGNTAAAGGALFVEYGSVKSYSTLFRHNRANQKGGAVYLKSTWFSQIAALFAGCVFHDNSAEQGGVAYLRGWNGASSFPTYSSWANCTMAFNRATLSGGAIHEEDDTTFLPVTLVNSSILWNNSGGAFHEIHGSPNVEYSTVTGGYPGPGNLSAAPLFADPAHRDLRLSLGSPGIDAGDGTSKPLDLADLDDDLWLFEAVPFDFDGAPRYIDVPEVPDTGKGSAPVVDMGAFELQRAPKAGSASSAAGAARARAHRFAWPSSAYGQIVIPLRAQ